MCLQILWFSKTVRKIFSENYLKQNMLYENEIINLKQQNIQNNKTYALKHVLSKFCLATLLLLQNKQNMGSHFGNNDSDQHVADTCAYKYYGSGKQFEIIFSENHLKEYTLYKNEIINLK